MTYSTETGAAIHTVTQRLIYAIRCWACEVLTGWALKASPPGYVSGMVEACLDAHRKGTVHGEQPAAKEG